MSGTTRKTEYEELTIDTVEGLQAFLQNAQAQYNIGLKQEMEGEYGVDHFRSERLDTAFQNLRLYVRNLMGDIDSGRSVTPRDARELQKKYDLFVDVIHQKPTAAPTPEHDVSSDRDRSSIEMADKEKVTEPASLNAPRPEKVKESEEVSVKPRTGKLQIASEDTVVQQSKEHVAVIAPEPMAEEVESPKKKKKKRKRKKKKSAPAEPVTTAESVPRQSKEQSALNHKLIPIITRTRKQYKDLLAQYPNPNLTQEILLEEVREGVEHLELLSKKPEVTKEQLLSAAEIADHIKNALLAVREAEVVEVAEQPDVNSVPIIVNVNENDPEPEPAVSFVPASVTAATKNSVKRSVPKTLSSLPRPDDIHEAESLTEKYLTAPKYIRFIAENYSTPGGFERILDATITKMEASTIDHIEKWLGDLPASAFHYIKDMTLVELAEFSDSGFVAIKEELQKQNVKYETFVLWQDLVDEMVQVIPPQPTMKFAQLFTLWMAELAMDDGE